MPPIRPLRPAGPDPAGRPYGALATAPLLVFAAGACTGIIGVVCVAIRPEEKHLTLTSEATSHVTQAGRLLNGVGVRALHRQAPR